MALKGSINYVWHTQHILGEGATGKVFKGVHKNNGTPVAVKAFNPLSYKRALEVQTREFEFLKKLNHENIVKLLAIEDDLEGYGKVIVMELCTGGSLHNILDDPENTYGLCEKEFLLVLEHLSAGMKHLRDNNLVHRDLKPGNIMKFLSEDGKVIYKLIDFGAARELEENQDFMSLCGTEEYLHPEMYERALLGRSNPKTFTSNVDLWSIGVTLYHVATGTLPFQSYGGRRNRKTMHLICTTKASGVISGIQVTENGEINWSNTLPNHCRLSEGLQTFVTPLLAGLLECNRDKIWSFDQFFKTVTSILSKRVLHVFFMNQANRVKILLESDYRFDTLQEFISLQTKVIPENQIMLFDKDQLEPKWGSSRIEEEFSETGKGLPIFLYNRNNNNVQLIPPLELSGFPTFSDRLSIENDVNIAKKTCSLGHEYQRRIEKLTLVDDLIKSGVEQFIEAHKIALNKLLEKTSNFNQVLSHMTKLLQIISSLSKPGIGKLVEELNSLKIKFDETSKGVHQLYERCVTGDSLRQEWRSLIHDKNKFCENTYKYRAKTYVECLRESWRQILRYCKAKSLTHNDEQFHALEKIKMRGNGEKLKTLLDVAQLSATKKAECLADWYKLAQTFYFQTQILDKDFEESKTQLSNFLDLKLNEIEETITKNKKLRTTDSSGLKEILKKFEEERKKIPNIIQENSKLLEDMVAFLNTEAEDIVSISNN